MKTSHFFLLILLISVMSCQDSAPINLGTTKNRKPNPAKTAKTITILPLGKNLSQSFIQTTYTEIKKFLPAVQLAPTSNLPAATYSKIYKRYRSDSLIAWMSSIAKKDQVYLGITNVDISMTKNGKPDWGVMGQGYCPGNAAVASNFRMKNKSAFWKVAIHELGHTSGLPHCPVATCFMRDAKGGNPTNEEKEFCPKCKAVLIKNGWKL